MEHRETQGQCLVLRKLVLMGFKSFAQKTTLRFSGGVTGIVGPNGSGKSNVLEALRFVMGQGAARDLRATAAQELCFSGTKSRRRAGFCQVSALFESGGQELELTKKVLANGEVTTWINQKVVRQKQVQQLLMTYGLGREGFWSFAQGKVESLIEMKGQERRKIFEESSGVSLYLMQKQEVCRRVDKARERLERVEQKRQDLAKSVAKLESEAQEAQDFFATRHALEREEKGLFRTQIEDLAQQIATLAIQRERLKTEKHEAQLCHQEAKREVLESQKERVALESRKGQVQEMGRQHGAQKRQVLREVRKIEQQIQDWQDKRTDDRIALEPLMEQKRQAREHEAQIEAMVRELLDQRNALDAQMQAISESRVENYQYQARIREHMRLIEKRERERKVLEQMQQRALLLESQRHQGMCRVEELCQELADLESKQAFLAQSIRDLRIDGAVIVKNAQEIALVQEREASLHEAKEAAFESLPSLLEALEMQDLCFVQAKYPRASHTFVVASDSMQEWIDKAQRVGKEVALIPQDLLEELGPGVFASVEEAWLASGERWVPSARVYMASSQLTVCLGKEATRAEQKIELALQKARLEATRHALEAQHRQYRDRVEEKNAWDQKVIQTQCLLQEAKREVQRLDQEWDEVKRSCVQMQQKACETVACTSSQELEAKLFETQQEQEVLRKDLLEAQKKHFALEDQMRAHHTRAKTYRQKIEELEASIQHAHVWNARHDTSRDQAQEVIGQLEEQHREMEKKLSEIMWEEKRADEEGKRLLRHIEEAHEVETGCQERERKIAQQFHEVSHALERTQVRYEEVLRQHLECVTRLYDQFEMKPEELTHLLPPGCPKKIQQLRRLVHERTHLNLIAVEELSEQQKALETLTSQTEDLQEALTLLEKELQQIEKRARKQFLDHLKALNVLFQEKFALLFQGGEACLCLEGDRDPFAARVEIHAQPRGKQLTSLQLLSGGEKCLTAIALLLALHAQRPSPLCLLDELDAPLDESNVQRFAQVLSSLKKTSQVILITHNPLTMEHLDEMQGVTMQEAGVSMCIPFIDFFRNRLS